MQIPYTVELRRDTGLTNGKIGIWLFLASEVMLFGALFASYILIRAGAPSWPRGDTILNVPLATFNTIVLITSSVTMVMAWASLMRVRFGAFRLYMGATILLGLVFLVVKYFEYSHKFHLGLLPGAKFIPLEAPPQPHGAGEHAAAAHANHGEHAEGPWVDPDPARPINVHIFFGIYFLMTGLHGLHVLGGMAAITWLLLRNLKGHFSPAYSQPVELVVDALDGRVLTGVVQRVTLQPQLNSTNDEHYPVVIGLTEVPPNLRAGMSVLDVGCASGRFYELVKSYNASVEFAGVDVSEKNIQSARTLYPHCSFTLGNAIGFDAGRTYELVNATGVVQHEADYRGLIESMFGLSERYVMFDAKISASGHECVDSRESYSESNGHRVPFNVFRLGWLVDHLMQNFPLRRLEIFGYETKPNAVTTLPRWMGAIYSVGVFCEKATGSPEKPAEIEIKIQ